MPPCQEGEVAQETMKSKSKPSEPSMHKPRSPSSSTQHSLLFYATLCARCEVRSRGNVLLASLIILCPRSSLVFAVDEHLLQCCCGCGGGHARKRPWGP